VEMDKRYDHQTFDQEIKNFWDQNGVYTFVADKNKEIFSVDTPPPTVSGTLHIGHVFSYTHTDLIVRYKRMQGFNAFYPMGFDDNGLATERFVEKKNGLKAQNLKRSDFIELCLKDCAEAEKDFEKLWKTLGLSVDWGKTYSTIGRDARVVSQKSFLKLLKDKKIYRKQEPALYCTTCQTSIAQADLDNDELASTFNTVAFKTEAGEELLIATTRPELLPACVALMYNPNDARYGHLKGMHAITPVFGKRVPCIADEKVDLEKGTGLVMCCTFGDPTDIYWFKTYNLPFVQVVGRNGQWSEATGPLQGLKVIEARKRMLELLSADGSLREQLAIRHNVPVHERCKQGIEYLILTQWFVDILNHKKDFLAQADKINWHPAFMKARYIDWVEHLNWDWCISRQRFYGIPFPVWHCNACNEVLLASDDMLPIDPQEQVYPGGACACGSKDLRPDTDVMDTWNTSSITPQLVTRWELDAQRPVPMPMSMRPQAHDIIRTWAFYTIVKAFYHNNDIPWKDLVISGHVLAGKEKISKSKGNEKITPASLLEAFSPDVIRFWAASGTPGADTAFSENQLKIGQKLVTKLWNAMRFSAEFLQGYTPATQRQELGLVNEWLHDEFAGLVQRYCTSFDAFDYSKAIEIVEKFFWQDFCDNYLELIKDQIFNPTKYTAEQLEATRYTLYTVSYGLLQLYAPFIPFVTEKLYQLLFRGYVGTESLHATLLNRASFAAKFPQSGPMMQVMLGLVNQVRKLKSEQQVSLKTPIANLVVHVEDVAKRTVLQAQVATLTGITQAVEVSFEPSMLEQERLEASGESFIAHVRA
jgi:valyl-tRNA synthetase